jgi:trk system potassium uptake protein TrkA
LGAHVDGSGGHKEGSVTERRVRTIERVAVIGLGRFGTSVARTLQEIGFEVTGIDIAEKPVAAVAHQIALAAQGDGSDEELLRSLNVEQSHVAIVAQGENVEANVLSTFVLKRMGVPWVVARASSAVHGEVLRRVGADRTVFPERDAGVRLAHSLPVRDVTDYISLSPTAGVAKFPAPAQFVGHRLGDLNANHTIPLSVLLIKRGEALLPSPPDDEVVRPGDEFVVAGADRDLAGFVEGAADQLERGAERGER